MVLSGSANNDEKENDDEVCSGTIQFAACLAVDYNGCGKVPRGRECFGDRQRFALREDEMPLYSTKPGYQVPAVRPSRGQPQKEYATPKAWHEIQFELMAEAVAKLKAAIASHLIYTFVNESGVKVKGCFASSLTKQLRYDGWKNLPNQRALEDGCERLGFIVIHGVGNEWSNKPEYRGQWYEAKDWLKNGRKAIGKYQTFIAMEERR